MQQSEAARRAPANRTESSQPHVTERQTGRDQQLRLEQAGEARAIA
jgi:hypothetical protein